MEHFEFAVSLLFFLFVLISASIVLAFAMDRFGLWDRFADGVRRILGGNQ